MALAIGMMEPTFPLSSLGQPIVVRLGRHGKGKEDFAAQPGYLLPSGSTDDERPHETSDCQLWVRRVGFVAAALRPVCH